MLRTRIKRLIWVLVLIAIPGLAACVWADQAEDMAARLPGDSAVYAVLERPRVAVDRLLRHFGIEEATLHQLYELSIDTDPNDGTELGLSRRSVSERSSDRTVSLLEAFLAAESVIFVGFESRDSLGGWLLLLEQDQEQEPRQLSREECRRILKVLSRGTSLHEGVTSIAPSLSESLSDWEMTVAIDRCEDWIVVASSDVWIRKVFRSMGNGEVSFSALSASHAYQSFVETHESASLFRAYLANRHAKQLVKALGWADDEQWRAEGWDAMPWQGCSVDIESDSAGLRIDSQVVTAVTRPLVGKSELWKHYRGFDDAFLPLPEEAVFMAGRHVDLEQWHATARRIYPDLYGPGVYESYAEDAVTAFKTGTSRPGLGDVQIEYRLDMGAHDGESESAILYQRAPQLSVSEVMEYLSRFYTGVNIAAKRRGMAVDFRQTEVQGNLAWWKIAEPDAGEGSILIENWVVQGKRRTLDRLVDWGRSAKLKSVGATESESLLMECADRFRLGSFHAFELERGTAILEKIESWEAWSSWILPIGGDIHPEVLDVIRQHPDSLEYLSRPQQLRIVWESLLARIRARTMIRVRLEGFEEEWVTAESWRFGL